MDVRGLRARLAGRSRLADPVQRVRALHDSGLKTRVRFDPHSPVLILSPHLDDAVLSCWSVLGRDGEARVVNVFAGVPAGPALSPWDRLGRATDARQRMEERLTEDTRALATAGHRAVNLELLDDEYRNVLRRPSLARLDVAVADQVPVASRVLAPLGVSHPDHKLVQRHAIQMSRAGMPVTLYAEVPQAASYGWPHWVTGEPVEPHLDPEIVWEGALARLGARGVPDARVERLSSTESEKKLEALSEYRTQFAALDGGSLGVLRNESIRRFEVFWDLP